MIFFLNNCKIFMIVYMYLKYDQDFRGGSYKNIYNVLSLIFAPYPV